MPKTRTLGFRLAQERRLKQAREERDIDFSEIAKAVRVSVSTYSRYEADLTKPDDETLGLLAHYYGVTRSWLRFEEGEKYPAPEFQKDTGNERDITAKRPISRPAAGGRRNK